MSDSIGLGSWVVHQEYGFAQVWGVWQANPDDPEVADEDDGVVVIATGTECFSVFRETLALADLGPEPAAYVGGAS